MSSCAEKKQPAKDESTSSDITAPMPSCRRFFARNWSVWLLSSLAVFSLGLLSLTWLTDFFNDAIVSNLQLSNGSLSFAWWQRPSVRAVYRIRIFNYTNVDEFMNGEEEKLRVQELGPYIYRETLTRVNPEIEVDGRLSYQEQRTYQWEGGSPDDERIVVPNVPLFTAMAFSRDMSFLAQVSLTAVLSTIRAKPFIQVRAGDFLWGYDDELFRISKPVLSWQQNIPFDKFGMLAFVSILYYDTAYILEFKSCNCPRLGNRYAGKSFLNRYFVNSRLR